MECIFLVETVGTCCISPDYTGSKFCFDVSDTKGESCAYGLPRVVGMNTALEFGYICTLRMSPQCGTARKDLFVNDLPSTVAVLKHSEVPPVEETSVLGISFRRKLKANFCYVVVANAASCITDANYSVI